MQRLPQPPSQPDIAKRAAALHTHTIKLDRGRPFSARRALEEIELIAAARNLPRKGLRVGATLCVQFAELRQCFLDHLTVLSNRTDQAPVDVRFAILANRRVSEIQARRTPRLPYVTGLNALEQEGKLALHVDLEVDS